MPRQRCTKNGKPGYRYGRYGTCYTYTPGNKTSRNRAKRKAEIQGSAIRRQGGK